MSSREKVAVTRLTLAWIGAVNAIGWIITVVSCHG